jgi:hypothetical protein
VLFLLAAGWLIVNTFMATPRQAMIGAGIIALGLPLYWYFDVSATRTGAADPLVSQDDA